MNDLNINTNEQVVEQDPNALGNSEHDKAMIAAVENQSADSTESNIAEQAAEVAEENSRPEWLPEKFKSVEDMAKAYAALESKLGSKEEQPQEPTTSEPSMVDSEKYNAEFMETGTLGEESRAELNARGIPNEMIDGYLESIRNQTTASTNQFIEAVGGQDKFTAVSEWAASGAAEANLIEAYNSAINRGDTVTAQVLFGNLSTAYEQANGTFGRRVNATATSQSSDGFQSMAEMTNAMSDPRYMGSETQRDPAYIREIEARLARSKF